MNTNDTNSTNFTNDPLIIPVTCAQKVIRTIRAICVEGALTLRPRGLQDLQRFFKGGCYRLVLRADPPEGHGQV